MKNKLYILCMIFVSILLPGCSTSNEKKPPVNYQIQAKLWVDGKLKSSPVVMTLENRLAETSQVGADESFGLTFLVSEPEKDFFKMKIGYKFFRGAIAEGGNMMAEGKMGAVFMIKDDNAKIEFKVIKI